MGLTIVRNNVDLHNGEIRVSSEGTDKGATFTVTLPLQQEFYDKNNSGDTPMLPTNGGGRLKDTSILLVDDDVESLQPLQAFLESQKATVVCANSVNDALTKLAVADFHILVSDIGMPSLDGYQLIHLIRNMTNGRNSRIPAIALTAYASEDDRQKALAAGFQNHFSKPADYDALLTAIETARRPAI